MEIELPSAHQVKQRTLGAQKQGVSFPCWPRADSSGLQRQSLGEWTPNDNSFVKDCNQAPTMHQTLENSCKMAMGSPC